MAAGFHAWCPAAFDAFMTKYGLAPEDIDSTADAVDAAKRQWRIEMAKGILKGMEAGRDASSPHYFDTVMAQFGLTAEDIGSTAEEIACGQAAVAHSRNHARMSPRAH
jgi:hypothetical protein